MTPCHDDEPARDGHHFITQYQLLDDSSGGVLHFPIKSAATENFFLTQPKPVKLSHSQAALLDVLFRLLFVEMVRGGAAMSSKSLFSKSVLPRRVWSE